MNFQNFFKFSLRWNYFNFVLSFQGPEVKEGCFSLYKRSSSYLIQGVGRVLAASVFLLLSAPSCNTGDGEESTGATYYVNDAVEPRERGMLS